MRPADDLCSAIGSFEVTRDPVRSFGAARGNLRYLSLVCTQLWVSTERATTIVLSGILFFKGFFDIL
jgi:hypothetical protein